MPGDAHRRALQSRHGPPRASRTRQIAPLSDPRGGLKTPFPVPGQLRARPAPAVRRSCRRTAQTPMPPRGRRRWVIGRELSRHTQSRSTSRLIRTPARSQRPRHPALTGRATAEPFSVDEIPVVIVAPLRSTFVARGAICRAEIPPAGPFVGTGDAAPLLRRRRTDAAAAGCLTWLREIQDGPRVFVGLDRICRQICVPFLSLGPRILDVLHVE